MGDVHVQVPEWLLLVWFVCAIITTQSYSSVCAHFMDVVKKTSHDLQIWLYSHQHLLPTRSALQHDDHSDLPYTMELHCSGKK